MTTPAPRNTLITPGEIAPDFTVQTQDRQPWTLSEHVKQGDVVLCFFPFAFTGVCGTEMECLSKEMSRLSADGRRRRRHLLRFLRRAEGLGPA